MAYVVLMLCGILGLTAGCHKPSPATPAPPPPPSAATVAVRPTGPSWINIGTTKDDHDIDVDEKSLHKDPTSGYVTVSVRLTTRGYANAVDKGSLEFDMDNARVRTPGGDWSLVQPNTVAQIVWTYVYKHGTGNLPRQ